METPHKPGVRTRRQLLDLGLRTCALSSVASILPTQLPAQTNSRVLVCIYLAGGNDSHNLVVPMSQYSSYAVSRGSLAIAAGDLLPSRAVDDVDLGFHPATGGLRNLFDLAPLAVIANVGELRAPLANSLDPDVAYIKGGFFTSRWAATLSGAYSAGLANGAVAGFPGASGSSNGLTFLGANGASSKAAILKIADSASTKIQTQFPSTPIGQQLLQVVRVLKSGATNGVGNRMFFAVHGNYDTHHDQLNRQASLLGQLSDAMSAFYAATVEIGVAHSVTTFTDSPFGRTLKSNQTGGTDHGWSSHQLVMGGSVLGRKVYGQFPDLQVGSGKDVSGSGVWAPTILRSSYTAALATWNGASRGAVSAALPEQDFGGSQNLDFLI
jgi:uncharacterized protein (DUF1501 family)